MNSADQDQTPLHRTAAGSVLIQAGRTTVLLRGGRAGRARLDERAGPRLADGRIRHVARQHEPRKRRDRRQNVDGRTTRSSG